MRYEMSFSSKLKKKLYHFSNILKKITEYFVISKKCHSFAHNNTYK